MRKLLKKWWVWLGTVTIVIFALACFLIALEESPINQANCDRVQLGMNWDQVGLILDRKYFFFAQRPAAGNFAPPEQVFLFKQKTAYEITISFDPDRGVTVKHFTPTKVPFWELMKCRI